MSTNYNRIKVADLETNEPDKILTTNQDGELEFSNINSIKTNNYNALDYTIEGKALDARQGKVLKTSIDALTSTKQDNLTESNVGTFENTVSTVTTIADTDKVPLLIGSLRRMISWASFKALFKTVNGNSLFGSGNIPIPDMDTTTAQSVSGLKTFLNLMLGLRNAANTFTSFVTNSATASRTWIFPDKSGTVAMTSDLPTNIVGTGTQNYLSKYNNSAGTQLGNSRISDTGTYAGIGTQNTPTMDFSFGNQSDRKIGNEDSDNTTKGRDFEISAGRAINFVFNNNFNALSQGTRQWFGMCKNLLGDILVCVNNGDIYKQTGGTGNFISLAQTARTWRYMAVDPTNGDVYATVNNGDIYKQTGGVGNFISIGAGVSSYEGIAFNSIGDLFVSTGGSILKRQYGTSSFINQGFTGRSYIGIHIAPNNDLFTCVYNGDVYKQTNSTGALNPLGFTARQYRDITIAPNNDLYVVVQNGDVYKQTNSTGALTPLGLQSASWQGILPDDNNNVYLCGSNTDIYKQINYAPGAPNLDGGTLKHKAGTGKGTGKSRQEFYTGQKTTSGTNMQTDTLRGYFDENGFWVWLTVPIYENDAAADADSNLPSKAFYKITGSRGIYQKP